METSPAAVNEVGREVVNWFSLTEKRLDPPLVILNRLPVMSPVAPMFNLNKSPEAVAGVVGDQSREANLPEVRAVEVEERFSRLPVVKAVPEMLKTLPVVVTVEAMLATPLAAVSTPKAWNLAEAVAVPPTIRS